MAPTPKDRAEKIREDFGTEEMVVCILGSTSFQNDSSAEFVKVFANRLQEELGEEAKFVTGGNPGVQESFAESCGDGSRVWNLVSKVNPVAPKIGENLEGGETASDNRTMFGLLGDVYVTLEGGPGVAEEARAAHARGALVLPVQRSGGASGGMFDFPKAALEKPEHATQEQWDALISTDTPVVDAAEALVAILKEFAAKRKPPSLMELLDQLISIDRGTLTKMVIGVLLSLILISAWFIYREVVAGRTSLAFMHGGFLVLVLCLAGSIAFVVAETIALEDEKKEKRAERKKDK